MGLNGINESKKKQSAVDLIDENLSFKNAEVFQLRTIKIVDSVIIVKLFNIALHSSLFTHCL